MGESATARRKLGHSTVEVTRLGLGTAPIGGLFSSVGDREARHVVRRVLDEGVGYVDTAPFYGHGVSERRISEVLRSVDRDSFTLSTKVGRLIVPVEEGQRYQDDLYVDAPPSEAVFDYSKDGILRSLDESLARLGLDRVDIAYIHDPDDHEQVALQSAYPVLHELRDQGVLGAIGVGMNQSRIPTRFVRETDVDAVLLAGRYTLLDQSGAQDLLPACVERGASVVIGGVYNSGLLANPEPGATYNYSTAPDHLVARARRLGEVCAAHQVPLQAAAIQFPLAHPAVACVLTGVRAVEEFEQNLAMLQWDIPAALWSDLEEEGVVRR